MPIFGITLRDRQTNKSVRVMEFAGCGVMDESEKALVLNRQNDENL